MHGEYKVPGGKLVVVDLEVREGRIADFHLAGDFFLEPDDALADIDAAVTGLPVETDVAGIAAAVRAALHDAALALDGHHLVLLLHRETRLKRDGASKFHRAEMRFRAVTEPDG